MFFDEADHSCSLSNIVFEPIKNGFRSKDPEILRPTVLLLRAAFSVITKESVLKDRFLEILEGLVECLQNLIISLKQAFIEQNLNGAVLISETLLSSTIIFVDVIDKIGVSMNNHEGL